MGVYVIEFQTNLSHNFISVANGSKFKVHVKYNPDNDLYFLDVDKFVNNTYKNIFSGINLVTGVDLFSQFAYHNIGKLFVVPYKKEFYGKEPTASTIVENFFMVWEHN